MIDGVGLCLFPIGWLHFFESTGCIVLPARLRRVDPLSRVAFRLSCPLVYVGKSPTPPPGLVIVP